ncbi:MAG: hypothetical protein ABFS05_01115 [Bacteroidota bacterium]
MEEFIYIVIGVIWLAASIYKATKKSKQKTSPQKPVDIHGEKQTEGISARSLLEELLNGQQVQIPEPESRDLSFEEVVETAEEHPARSFQGEYANSGLQNLESLSGEGVSSLDRITFKDELKEVTKKASGQNKINLRKAIIYSTILERPYS